MDGLSGAASIIAVVQITGQILGLCQTYFTAVRSARQDIKRLQDEIVAVNGTLSKLADLADDHDPSGLAASRGLKTPLLECRNDLESLLLTLQTGGGGLAEMSKFGLRSLKWPLKKKDVDKAIATIERFKTTVTLAIGVDIMSKAQLAETKIKNVTQEIEASQVQSAAVRENDIREKISSWIRAPDPTLNFQNAQRRREAATGEWFLKSSKFLTWSEQRSSLLWLYGMPGCGKTILSASTILSLQKRAQSEQSVVILYFYFDFNDNAKQNAEGCVRSLMKQFSAQCHAGFTVLKRLWEKHNSGESQPSFESLLETLRLMIPFFDQSYIIMDALDECFQREDLMQLLMAVDNWHYPNVHLMVTSRKEREIDDCLSELGAQTVCLCEEDGNTDIKIYIDICLDEDVKLKKWPQSARDEIRKALMERADGMFRWVACQLDALRKCLNMKALQTTLQSLPRTLDETYERILVNIDEDYREDALNMLSWLCFSARPLRLDELQDAMAVTVVDGTPLFDSSKRLREPLDISIICPSLLMISDSLSVSLAHFSVREYLESERIRSGRAAAYAMTARPLHCSLAASSLHYLSHSFSSPSWTLEYLEKEYPLASYAAQYWTYHLRECSAIVYPSSILKQTLMLLCNVKARAKWLDLWDPDRPTRTSSPGRFSSQETWPLGADALYYAALEGLTPVASQLRLEVPDIDVTGGLYGSPLQAAIHAGHTKIAKDLIEQHANIHQRNGYYGHSLSAAASQGSLEMVEILLRLGVDPNMTGEGPWVVPIALHTAAEHGHLDIVRVLVSNGANVNKRWAGYRTALGFAAGQGHEDVVRYLLAKGAVANDGDALESATWAGKHKIVNLLIQHGADIGGSGSALEGAVCNGTLDTVELLIRNGANIHARGPAFGSALIAAASRDKVDTAQLLVDNGADPNMTNPQSGTYLHSATRYGESAIQIASRNGSEQMVLYLLSHGADPNLPGPICGNPLSLAAHRARLKAYDVVKLLLHYGANPNVEDRLYGTALRAAAASPSPGAVDIVKILLETGAEIDTQTQFFPTALHSAVLAGRKEIVQLLIDRGANFQTNHPRYGTPLQAAIKAGFGEMESLLREHGAFIEMGDGSDADMMAASLE